MSAPPGLRRYCWWFMLLVGANHGGGSWAFSVSNKCFCDTRPVANHPIHHDNLIAIRYLYRNTARLPVLHQQNSRVVSDGGPWQTWKASDVYQDLYLLEQAINLANAEDDWKHNERMATLDYFAQQRRLLAPDIRKFVLIPALTMSLIILMRNLFATPYPVLVLEKVLTVASLSHAYITTFIPPIIFWGIKSYRRERNIEPPSELNNIDPQYRIFLTNQWDDPTKSTNDSVLCLLEQWTSSILGFTLFGMFLPNPWRHLCLGLTRLASWTSFHQFPKLYFDLYRTPRPLPASAWLLQSLLFTLQSTTRWLIAMDLGLFLSSFARRRIVLTGCAIAVFVITLCEQRFDKVHAVVKNARKAHARAILPLIIAIALGQAISNNFIWIQMAQAVLTTPGTFRDVVSRCITWQGTASTFVMLASLMLPICHLWAFTRLVNIQRTHNISLACDHSRWTTELAKPNAISWRWKLRWREPMRIRVVWDRWQQQFWYWFFFKGTVTDKLRRDELLNRRRKSELRQKGLDLWSRVASDGRGQATPAQWKQDAMNRLSEKHASDYEKGTFEDPLGVAVYKALGIGLGFKFDHMSEPKLGEATSTRRLQSRAAKSAVRRVQELYDPVRVRKMLDSIADPIAREQRKITLQRETKDEIEYIAKRLSELIPTDCTLENDMIVEQLDMSNYARSSDNKYVHRPSTPSSKTVESLMWGGQGYDIDYLNPENPPEKSADHDELSVEDEGTDQPDDESDFIIETWVDQRRSRSPDVKAGDGDDSDEDSRIVLA